MGVRTAFPRKLRTSRINRKKVTQVVELDQMKTEILTYETPLAEVRDSL